MTTADLKLSAEYPVICATCGQVSQKSVPVDDKYKAPKKPTTACPKCSNKAFLLTMQGTSLLTVELAREVVRLRNDIFDLQSEAEEREGQGHDR